MKANEMVNVFSNYSNHKRIKCKLLNRRFDGFWLWSSVAITASRLHSKCCGRSTAETCFQPLETIAQTRTHFHITTCIHRPLRFEVHTGALCIRYNRRNHLTAIQCVRVLNVNQWANRERASTEDLRNSLSLAIGSPAHVVIQIRYTHFSHSFRAFYECCGPSYSPSSCSICLIFMNAFIVNTSIVFDLNFSNQWKKREVFLLAWMKHTQHKSLGFSKEKAQYGHRRYSAKQKTIFSFE